MSPTPLKICLECKSNNTKDLEFEDAYICAYICDDCGRKTTMREFYLKAYNLMSTPFIPTEKELNRNVECLHCGTIHKYRDSLDHICKCNHCGGKIKNNKCTVCWKES